MMNAMQQTLFLSALALATTSTSPTPVSCTHDCCWTITVYKAIGGETNADPTLPRGCCKMYGVFCDSSSPPKVEKLGWKITTNRRVYCQIPPEIGNLVNLQSL